MPRVVCFDVFGTSFVFDRPIAAIEKEFGQELERARVSARSVFFEWFYAVQRDFTVMSLADNYTPMPKIFASTLRRPISASLSLPPSSIPTKSLEAITSTLTRLRAVPNLIPSLRKLEEAGKFEIWPVTNGGKDSTFGLYKLACEEGDGGEMFKSSGESDKEGFLERLKQRICSCDDIKVAKPVPVVYEKAKERIGFTSGLSNPSKPGMDGDSFWFVAAHQWDLCLAKKHGFKTAFLTYEEFDPCTDIFGQPDVIADSMDEAVQKMLEFDGVA